MVQSIESEARLQGSHLVKTWAMQLLELKWESPIESLIDGPIKRVAKKLNTHPSTITRWKERLGLAKSPFSVKRDERQCYFCKVCNHRDSMFRVIHPSFKSRQVWSCFSHKTETQHNGIELPDGSS